MDDPWISTTAENLSFVEELFARYLEDRESVPAYWRTRFAPLTNGQRPVVQLGPSFRPRSLFNPCPPAPRPVAQPESRTELQDRLNQMIANYRMRGHMLAQLDPLGTPRGPVPELEPAYYGFGARDLELLTVCSTLPYDEPLTLHEILRRLRNTYCRSIGVQFMHLDEPAPRRWLQQRMERTQNRLHLSHAEQLRILTRLTDAVIFEEFLRKKFIGAKTFSLEGCETLLPLLDLALEKACQQGACDVVIGMAHRGRLNVLANIIGKSPRDIFREFADAEPERWTGRGDVRYHLGYEGDWSLAAGGKRRLSLCCNPSHLEFINPVVLGRVRARQDSRSDHGRRQVLGLLIHGDAAFAAEGIVQETLNLSRLAGYRVGGILHIVINNQLGFTTSPAESRSTVYATDVARMLQAPVFHVNGEDPEAVAQVVRLAMDFRSAFRTDVFIDMYGYRRWGHNETDEPAFTQPLLYRAIRHRPTTRAAYLEHLLQLKSVTAEEADAIAHQRRQQLEQQLADVQQAIEQTTPPTPAPAPSLPESASEPGTGVPVPRLAALLQRLTCLPRGFHLHPKLERFQEARRAMAAGQQPLDWSAAEALALASLAAEGVRVRFSGQDAVRGAFSQRHAAFFDQQDGSPYLPLQHLTAEQGEVAFINSPLSEAGALGFEYGYSLDLPEALVVWEAQFGDFANAAQVIIDQFIASAEDKWEQRSGLVLLLPHGFEGMGPEHSSARLERFLQLAAEDNLRIVQPSTPAQYFHCLRRQALWRPRKPLVVLTPKSLLRHPEAVSPLSDCAQRGFQRLVPDQSAIAPERVLACSGKVYYDLAAYRKEHHNLGVAIVRFEQLYPLEKGEVEAALWPGGRQSPTFWVQEEPRNMGAWTWLNAHLCGPQAGQGALQPICRPESASPATGSAKAHQIEQQELVERAFARRAHLSDLCQSR